METLAFEQVYNLYVYILSGILIGIFFDIFRVLRKSFKTSDVITHIQDIVFWIFTGIFLLYVIFKFNDGEIRAFIFLGIAIGIALYIKIFSKYFIKVGIKIIDFFKLIISTIIKILILPFKFIRKVFFKPVSFIFINVTKTIKKFSNSTLKVVNKLNFFKNLQKKSSK